MKVLVVGSGGREHVLCWRLAQSGHEVCAAPGNGGIAAEFEVFDVSSDDGHAIAELATAQSIDLVVVGPEAPLVAGVADRCRERGILAFGPGADGARLEASKVHCKEFFANNDIPTGRYYACTTMEEVRVAVDDFGDECVVKADGLAAGKGVVVCSSREAAIEAAREMLDGHRFGAASATILIEEKLRGRELSLMAITDGKRYVVLEPAEDHKAVFDGDRGPNTGGMGAVCPAEWVQASLLETACTEIFDRTMLGLSRDGVDFRGVLYAGIMVTEEGPKMLEYNVRFGDPETQTILPRLLGDFGELLRRAAAGDIRGVELSWAAETAVGVVMASEGYPGAAETGRRITGLERVSDVLVFHAGTRRVGEQLETCGGRVLCVVGLGTSGSDARARAYRAVESIGFDGAHWRRDIGARSVLQAPHG